MRKHSFSLLLPLAIILVKGTAAVLLQACKAVAFVLSLYQRGHTASMGIPARAEQ